MKLLVRRILTITISLFLIILLFGCSTFNEYENNKNKNDLVYQILSEQIKDQEYIPVKKLKKEKVVINLNKNCEISPKIENGTLSEFVEKWQQYNTKYKDCNIKNEALKKEIIAISKFLKNVEVVIIEEK